MFINFYDLNQLRMSVCGVFVDVEVKIEFIKCSSETHRIRTSSCLFLFCSLHQFRDFVAYANEKNCLN